MKSILENQVVLELPLFAILGALKMVDLVSLPSKCAKIHKKSKFRASKCVKMADFAFLEPPILISRKI